MEYLTGPLLAFLGISVLVILWWKSRARSQVMDVSKVELRMPRAAACSP